MRTPSLARLPEALWYGRYSWLALPLVPLSLIYAALVSIRRFAWRSGLFRPRRLPVPVVVVGNLTVGGTGKTPVVDWVVVALREAGFSPGIVSRGYGRRTGDGPRLVLPTDDAHDVGDEPLLLFRSTGAPVCVGRDRVAAGERLLAEGVDVIVSDDGLQHYRLARDLEIAVVDGERRLGNAWLLPAGPLREPASRLGTVDLVLVNGGRVRAGEQVFQARIGELVALGTGNRRALGTFAGMTVRVVAGIGNPGRFCAELSAAGLRLVVIPVADHGRVPLEELCRDASTPIIMTGKDAVKYPVPRGPCEVWVATLEVRMPDGVREAVVNAVSRVAR